MRKFRGRRIWFWRGRRRRRPERQWGPGWTTSKPGSSPAWWKLITRPMMPPTLISTVSGLVAHLHLKSLPSTPYMCCRRSRLASQHRATEGRFLGNSSKKQTDALFLFLFNIQCTWNKTLSWQPRKPIWGRINAEAKCQVTDVQREWASTLLGWRQKVVCVCEVTLMQSFNVAALEGWVHACILVSVVKAVVYN